MLRVYRLAYRLYFRRAPWPTKLSCALRLFRNRWCARRRAPIAVMIGLTHRCQCRCVHCGIARQKATGEDELSREEVITVIGQARHAGAVEITLFGGEPLLRNDIDAIVRAARDRRMLCSIDTNGLLLSPERVRALKAAGLSAIKISLDSAVAADHDQRRSVQGCFNKALAAARACVAQDLPCVVSTYASRENVTSGGLKDIIELARDTGVTAVRIIDTTLSGCSLSSPHKMLTPDNREHLAALLEPGFVFLENLASSRKLKRPICSALTRRYIYVSPQGDVQPCCFVPLTFGNIRREPLCAILARLWNSALMTHDPAQCLMNNPAFRAQHLSRLETAETLPVDYGPDAPSYS